MIEELEFSTMGTFIEGYGTEDYKSMKNGPCTPWFEYRVNPTWRLRRHQLWIFGGHVHDKPVSLNIRYPAWKEISDLCNESIPNRRLQFANWLMQDGFFEFRSADDAMLIKMSYTFEEYLGPIPTPTTSTTVGRGGGGLSIII